MFHKEVGYILYLYLFCRINLGGLCMKTLVIVAHPNLAESYVNKIWVERLKEEENITLNDLYSKYPDGKINKEVEQQLLIEHDRIVFQFPFYWYSSPSLLKEWQDVVFTFGWAFGEGGTKLNGKEMILAISIGGAEEAYQDSGYNQFTINELTKPYQATANLIGMRFLPTFKKHEVHSLTIEQIRESAEELVQYLKSDIYVSYAK